MNRNATFYINSLKDQLKVNRKTLTAVQEESVKAKIEWITNMKTKSLLETDKIYHERMTAFRENQTKQYD